MTKRCHRKADTDSSTSLITHARSAKGNMFPAACAKRLIQSGHAISVSNLFPKTLNQQSSTIPLMVDGESSDQPDHLAGDLGNPTDKGLALTQAFFR